MKARVLLLASALAAIVVAGIVWQRGQATRRLQEAGGVPVVPAELAEWPGELRERIAAAHARAKSGSIDGLVELSRLYHANGFLREAMACYAALERLQPKEPRWPHRHASILAGYGDTDAALSHAQRAVELAPDYVPARLRLAEVLLKRNELERAAAVYGDVLRQSEHPHALLGLARIDVDAGRWTEARTRLERVVALTNYELGYDLIVTVYERLGMHAQAATIRGRAKASGAYRDPADPWIDELLADCYDPYRLSLAAGAAQRIGDSATALRWLERAVALAPEDAMVRFQLAGVYSAKQDLRSAREQLERCTKLAPQFPDAWAHLGALLEQVGDLAGAERVISAGLAQCPDSPGLHLMRARQHRRAGRIPAAVESYRRSIQLRANEAEPHVELATLLLQIERVAEAVQHLENALVAEPDHPTALSLRALTAIATQDEAGARRWLARVQAQPRITAAQAAPLLEAYRGQFGREFK